MIVVEFRWSLDFFIKEYTLSIVQENINRGNSSICFSIFHNLVLNLVSPTDGKFEWIVWIDTTNAS